MRSVLPGTFNVGICQRFCAPAALQSMFRIREQRTDLKKMSIPPPAGNFHKGF